VLTKLDDLPRHQIVETMATVGPSDLSFSDGYYYCFWDPHGKISIAAGLRVYPNVDVVDGYASVMREGRLDVVRMSRRWSSGYDNLSVGPLTLEVVEGLKLRRLRLEASEDHGGFEFDLRWRAVHVPYEEERRTERLHGRVIRDLIRYWQAGRPSGTVRFGDEQITVTERDWYCIMDHSWGLRQSTGPNICNEDLPPVPLLPEGRNGLLRLVILAQLPSCTAFVQTHEDASGKVLKAEGRIDWADGRVTLVSNVKHELSYYSHSRKLRSAQCIVIDDAGGTLNLMIEPTHTGTITSALGYQFESRGFADNRGMGVYRGEAWCEHDTWRHDGDETIDPAGRRHAYNGYIGPARVSTGSETGMAYFETVVLGAYRPYGFEAPGPVPVTILPIV